MQDMWKFSLLSEWKCSKMRNKFRNDDLLGEMMTGRQYEYHIETQQNTKLP